MAQRTIHMLLGTLAAEKLTLTDRDRFLLGCILPDAYVGPENRKPAHFITQVPGEELLYFDFAGFFGRFRDRVLADDLYLGYYAHLVTDAFYRHYVFNVKKLYERIKRNDLQILHNDYSILNAYIASAYRLPDVIPVPADIGSEALRDICPFDADRIVNAYREDLTEKAEGKTAYLTEEMLEEFTALYAGPLADELAAARQGRTLLDTAGYRYPR